VADDLTDFGMRGAMYTVNDESVTKPPKFFTNKDIQVAVTRIALILGVCWPYYVAPPLVLSDSQAHALCLCQVWLLS
jgi:hypothetical protein